MDWWLVVLWIAIAANVTTTIWNVLAWRQYWRARDVLREICLRTWLTRDWPQQHIVSDLWPPPDLRIRIRVPK